MVALAMNVLPGVSTVADRAAAATTGGLKIVLRRRERASLAALAEELCNATPRKTSPVATMIKMPPKRERLLMVDHICPILLLHLNCADAKASTTQAGR